MKNHFDNSLFYWSLILITSIIMTGLFTGCDITFDVTSGNITSVLFGYGLLATIVEKFCEMFIIKDKVSHFDAAISSFKTQEINILTNEKSSMLNILDQENSVTIEVRKWSFLIGIIFAGLGMNVFNELTEIICPLKHQHLAKGIYNILGLVLTATLISAGSSFVWSLTANAKKPTI